MAITRIRGGQIQDRTIDGVKIKINQLLDEHVASNAAIQESKLAIDWAAHTETLENKKVLDYVQIGEQTVENLSTFDATSIVGDITPSALSGNAAEGVIVDSPKNVVIVRDVVTGDPILGVNGREVYGRMEYTAAVPESVPGAGDGVAAKYQIAFFELDADSNEIAFTMSAGQKAEFQYLRRFNLLTVNEMFAANEKFVDGSADTNARLDLQQLAKDLYGNSWSLDHNGATNLTRSLVDEILAQTSGAVSTGVRASVIIDEVIAARGTFDNVDARLDNIESNVADAASELSTARGAELTLDARLDKMDTKNSDQDTAISQEIQDRQDADTAIKSDFASTDATVAGAGKGAEMVGVRDVGNKITATSVEGALAELADRATSLESGTGASNQEIVNARSSAITGDAANLDARLEAGEARYEAVKSEVDTARGTEANLNTRLGTIETSVSTEATNRQNADTAIVNDLASVQNSKGAALVGVEDATGKFDGATVEAVLAELQTNIESEATTRSDADTALSGRVTTLENGGGAEVSATHTRDADSANGYFVTGSFTDLEARIVNIETASDAEFKKSEDEIAQEIQDRQTADAQIVSDLASNANGKGASTIGIEDANGKFTSTQVEAALVELYDKITTTVAAGSETASASSDLRTKELESVGVKFGGQVVPATGMDLNVPAAIVYNAEGKRFETTVGTVTINSADATNPRIDVVYIDSLGVVQVAQGVAGVNPAVPSIPANSVKLAEVNVPVGAVEITNIADKRVFVATGSEVQAARGSMASVDARLSVAMNADGKLKAGAQIHDHKKHVEQVVSQTNVVNMPAGETFQADGTLNVYVNGILQANGVNFTEVYDVDGKGISVDFGTDPVLVGDVVILTWVNNNQN